MGRGQARAGGYGQGVHRPESTLLKRRIGPAIAAADSPQGAAVPRSPRPPCGPPMCAALAHGSDIRMHAVVTALEEYPMPALRMLAAPFSQATTRRDGS